MTERYEIVRQLSFLRRKLTLLREVDDALTRNRFGQPGSVTREWKLIYTKVPRER